MENTRITLRPDRSKTMKNREKDPFANDRSLVTADSFGMFIGGALLVVFAVQFLAIFG